MQCGPRMLVLSNGFWSNYCGTIENLSRIPCITVKILQKTLTKEKTNKTVFDWKLRIETGEKQLFFESQSLRVGSVKTAYCFFLQIFTIETGGTKRVVVSGYDNFKHLLITHAGVTSMRGTQSRSDEARERLKNKPGKVCSWEWWMAAFAEIIWIICSLVHNLRIQSIFCICLQIMLSCIQYHNVHVILLLVRGK